MATTTGKIIQDLILQERVNQLRDQIETLTKAAGRPPLSARLLAVSKGQSIESILSLHAAGVIDFAESYWQEAQEKIHALSTRPIHWHFIGHLQRNKLKKIAQHVDWVHSVCREEELLALARHREGHERPLQICIQVHVQGALGKRGVPENDLVALAKKAKSLKSLCLRGLMVMLQPDLSQDEQYQAFCHVRALCDQVNQTEQLELDTLSMGMSGDFQQAIPAGSTWVRVGRLLFS
ncbi:MAG: YggS family pyridoxal phosphate-dependent enzyme [Gammaproteobacteria bacterium]|nr:YggS family pyridoxal phosphate-dependent enzyme [Gammaproteobacteria bacterium]